MFSMYKIITKSGLYKTLCIIPKTYPNKIKNENLKLFPSTLFALNVLYAAIGQLAPKHTIIPASKILISFSFRNYNKPKLS